ncbi:DUF305 domain-containing protein [Micromonospora olivasterospora]|uniref:Uncharacterized protein (DUF305 family) n=1 Tax=Micromonospora olivasterospora TaxID=1880 RepID=A0A562IFJ9_MICOL|nr:DUF305 domain-containing protein [Micromonospora olivasterospora]TWH69801.1 uncharacterized protein (DUF305 family) [Micromonospora olivasterospora]
MPLSRRLIISAVVATAAVGAGITIALLVDGDDPPYRAPSSHVVQPGAPGQPGRTLSGEDLSRIPPPRFTAADTLFIQGMIPHHAQALAMTALVPSRTTNPDLALLAKRIDASQREEITRMQRWLEERDVPSAGPQAGHAGHDKLMPGMLTDEQLGQLRQARGAEFDRLFLTLMIRHHQGALAMVRELYATGGGLEPASDQFAREVDADQSIEIQRMQELLARLG